MKSLFPTFILSFIFLAGCNSDSPAGKNVDTADRVGGACDYISYEGTARIISVKETSLISGGKLEESREIKFVFESADTLAKATPGSFFSDTAFIGIADWKKPTKEMIKNLDLKVGKEFRCRKMVITEGTCTPVILEFPDDSLISSSFK